jgi:trehalose 6-phosphate synthase/phosphatase
MSPELYKKILNTYESSRKRILFLDYDGTLVSLKDKPQDATPDEELFKILSDLIKIKNTKVVIISGRDKITINKWLGHLPIDLVAEHGAWMRTNNEWTACAPLAQEWRSHIFPILNFFVERTPGSFIEEKDFSLGWHYRKADGGLGELRARELVDHLQYITGNMEMNIIEGKKVVEVKSSSVNKGRAVLNWLDKKYDFILAAGDDWTDEDMFKEMPHDAYTIKIGASPSIAKYNIASCDDEPCIGMRKLLKSFC